MSLIKCPECGKEISSKAKNCPNCGYQLKNNSKIKVAAISVVATMAILIGIWTYSFFGMVRLASESMEPTINTNEKVRCNTFAYILSEPERYDVVVHYEPDDTKHQEKGCKRIIGLPGETVLIQEGKVYINNYDTILDDSFCLEEPFGDYGPYEVPEDSYFMLGDNRNYSKDSRFWANTFVKREDIIGKIKTK